MEENKEITFGRILKVAFSNWKLFTPVALVVALGCALGIHFGYNTLKGKYSSTFSYSSADLANDKYADGSDFFYKNLISYSNLSAIKDSDEKYASINIDNILDKNGISISASDEGEKTYTISLGYKYIKDQKLAKSFIEAIAESALKKDAAIVNEGSYDASLKSFDNAKTFEEKVTFLNAQATYLTNEYKKLSNITSNQEQKQVSLPASALVKINDNVQTLDNLIPKTFVSQMNVRIADKGWSVEYTTAAMDLLRKKQEALTLESTSNDSRIAALEDNIIALGTSAAVTSLGQELETLILRNEDIKVEQAGITNKLAHEGMDPASVPGHTDFVNELAGIRSDLSAAIDAYKGVLKIAYVDSAAVDYEDSSHIKLNGTIGIAINALISVAVGVVVGAAVNLIVDRKKLYE